MLLLRMGNPFVSSGKKTPVVTVTPHGQTIVDANQLFKDEEVKAFLDSIRTFWKSHPEARGPRTGRIPAHQV